MQWKDPRLSWLTDDFNGTSEITLPVSKIWVPDIVIQVYNNNFLMLYNFEN